MKDLKILQKDFYQSQNTEQLAKSLLGKYLVKENSNSILIGQIIETEAYLQNDAAAHSYNGMSKRNEQLFEEAGTVYVYFTYGKHWCFNIVGNNKGVGEGVLIRGVKPVVGIDQMLRNRNINDIKNISNGPAKVSQAYQIDLAVNGHKIWDPPLYITEEVGSKDVFNIKSSKRIGISKNKDAMLRFFI